MADHPVLIGAFTVAALSAVALAADAPPSDAPAVSAQLLAPVPAGIALSVEPLDDNDDNIRLRDLMVARLVAQHGLVADKASLLLRFTAETLSQAAARGGRNAGMGARGGGGRGFGTAMAMRVYGADPPGAATGGSNAAGVRYQLRATLMARDGGPVLWQGRAIATVTGGSDARSLGPALASALVDSIGRTVETPAHPAADAAAPSAPGNPRP